MPLKTLDKIFEKDINNPVLTENYLEEKAKLENALAVLKSREAEGLTQRDLAEKSGVPQSTIARIEKGANTSLTTMCKIAFALDKQLKISLV
ncbi:helix-turn-helix transcriptional regulator [Veillonella sp. AF13-2]|uniref:helix-turn-helix domain-containing protein n=1 Tax=Veillonella sp. AF13-2 TaxID=2293250 RepID=UPI000EBD3DBA|nr:helix-turn-helix transcriptional regulator [Veillonella sp. AF13-2]RJV49422.1 XRE family transcriptional regulator [Veillonella sp. AF13-2]